MINEHHHIVIPDAFVKSIMPFIDQLPVKSLDDHLVWIWEMANETDEMPPVCVHNGRILPDSYGYLWTLHLSRVYLNQTLENVRKSIDK